MDSGISRGGISQSRRCWLTDHGGVDCHTDPPGRRFRHAHHGRSIRSLGTPYALIATALSGAVLSFTYGWLIDLPLVPLLLITFVYGFAVLGDSGVLSVAMTEAIHPQYLGSLLARRSILGFGAGAASPLVFGWILDVTNPSTGLPQIWGWAFMALGIGGSIATLCALILPRAEKPKR
jgi:MFS family permease